MVLVSSTTTAESISANASVIVPASCTFTSTENTPHAATIPNGTNQTDIGTTTFNITCNDSEGYSLYAIGYSNKEDSNTNLLANISGALSPTNNIITGTSTSGDVSNWSMKLAPVDGTSALFIQNGYNNYSVVPNQHTKVGSFSSATSGTTSASVTSTYQAYISPTQPAGTYSGKVKYTFLHPAALVPNEKKDCTPGKICYWPNGNGEVRDSMGDQTVGSSATTADLWASNFQRKGYGFAGWSTTYDYDESNENTKFYGPNETITDTETLNIIRAEGLSLYAIWIKSIGYLQDWGYCSLLDPAVYNSETGKIEAGLSSVTALTDKRDNDTYAVARLTDDNCWMIENLRLDNDATHNSDGSLAQGYATDFIGLANPETNNFGTTISNSLYSTANISGSNQSYRFPRYNNENTANSINNMTSQDDNIYSYGNYYTWPAAIADTKNYSTTAVVRNTSICPSGWRLPIGNSGSAERDYSNIDISLGGTGSGTSGMPTTDAAKYSNKWRSFPNNYNYSGSFSNYSIVSRGQSAIYSSSYAFSSGWVNSLAIQNTSVSTGNSLSRTFGLTIRCIIDN